MFDLKVMNSALDQLEEERGIAKEKVLEAIELALAAAYRRDYGKKDQIIKAKFKLATGDAEFFQVKAVVDESMLRADDLDAEAEASEAETDEEDTRVKWNEERHIMLEDAKRIKGDVELGEEISFPLEDKGEYGRIAAQTAKQTILQKIREAEKAGVLEEYGKREGDIVNGTVQRVERGNVYVDLGKTTGVIFRDEQIPGEHYRQGERIRALLMNVDESPRGIAVKLSRSHPDFVRKLFEIEVPEIANEAVEIMGIAREAGSRSKVAVTSHDDSIDAVGSMVGQRGVRVHTVTSELGGEKIDIIEYSDLPEHYIANALSPGEITSIELDEDERQAQINVMPDQLSLVIGKGGQNVRLAARLTGWRLDIDAPDKPKYADSLEEDGIAPNDDDLDEDGAEEPGNEDGNHSEDTDPENLETTEEAEETKE